ncbi:MAG: hypothetical protein EBR02_09455 [Alphaproteobacteria bacterium]|nr:hypothetical protein [Alphaproteobacteria bacterium]
MSQRSPESYRLQGSDETANAQRSHLGYYNKSIHPDSGRIPYDIRFISRGYFGGKACVVLSLPASLREDFLRWAHEKRIDIGDKGSGLLCFAQNDNMPNLAAMAEVLGAGGCIQDNLKTFITQQEAVKDGLEAAITQFAKELKSASHLYSALFRSRDEANKVVGALLEYLQGGAATPLLADILQGKKLEIASDKSPAGAVVTNDIANKAKAAAELLSEISLRYNTRFHAVNLHGPQMSETIDLEIVRKFLRLQAPDLLATMERTEQEGLIRQIGVNAPQPDVATIASPSRQWAETAPAAEPDTAEISDAAINQAKAAISGIKPKGA